MGDVFWGDADVVEREAMRTFAKDYAVGPMHLDAAAARQMGLEDATSSAAFTFALLSKSMIPIMGGLAFLPSGFGIEMNFTAPVYPGNTLRARLEVGEARRSSKPGRGVIRMDHALGNQDDAVVMETNQLWLIGTREG